MKAKEKARWIAKRLHDRYGQISVAKRDPLEMLIRTILSQNTNDNNSERAYRALIERFGNFAAVKNAKADEIAAVIRIGGLHHQKAARIKQILNRIEKREGDLTLSFLANYTLNEMMTWLLGSPGIGPKTAGIVVLFSFDKPYFPVDTHIRRVLTRVGVVSSSDDPHEQMNAILPRDPLFMKQLHLQLIRFGRELCHPQRPACSQCLVRDLCNWHLKWVSGREGCPFAYR